MPKILYSLKLIQEIIKREKPSKVCIVTSNSLVKKLDWAIDEINTFGAVKIIIIPDGEPAKDWKEIEKLIGKFIRINLDRKSIVVALGGGTVGDTVGFVCSIYLRGIKYVQIPTTLLAQVDSAHGGKTGINFLGYKNQIGTFYPPLAIIIDTRFLKSLTNKQIIDGLGEIIKSGFIKDALILSLLKKETIDTLLGSPKLKEIIEKTIKVKEWYVNNDFNDNGVRQILNFGHTIGHSFELKYKVSHGNAVIIGMLKELEMTENLGLTDILTKQKLVSLLNILGINADIKFKTDWNNVLRDKKINGNFIFLPVVKKEGQSKLMKIKLNDFKKYIR